jgi:hypothetical protein
MAKKGYKTVTERKKESKKVKTAIAGEMDSFRRGDLITTRRSILTSIYYFYSRCFRLSCLHRVVEERNPSSMARVLHSRWTM